MATTVCSLSPRQAQKNLTLCQPALKYTIEKGPMSRRRPKLWKEKRCPAWNPISIEVSGIDVARIHRAEELTTCENETTTPL
jgi:hypothetical protein